MKYQGVIFDLDGVICSTDRYHYQAWKQMADTIGVHFDESINNKLRGVSRMESLRIILEGSEKSYSEEEMIKLAEQKNDIYRGLLQNMTPADITEDVKTTLDELRKRGMKLAIGSSSKNTKEILRRIGYGTFFDAISDGTNIVNSKPDPEVFLKAAQMLELQPGQCLVVEDAVAGIQAAEAGNFDSAGIGEASTYNKTVYPITSLSDLNNIMNE